MITLDHVTVSYPDSTPLDDVSLTIPPGSTAVMGPSGAGKSTLLRLLAGLQEPDAGHVLLDGTPVAVATWSRSSDPRVAMIHQDYRLVPFLTVRQNLLLAAELRELDRTDRDVVSALEAVTLSAEHLDRSPTTLSGGQQQRVAIARALLTDATLLLADEPTGALDARSTATVAEALARTGRLPGLTVVVATHDRNVADRMDTCITLQSGSVAAAR